MDNTKNTAQPLLSLRSMFGILFFLMMTGTEEQEDSSDDEILVYSIEDVLNTLKPYETEESVWSFVSDLTGISVDALLMMTDE